MSAEDPHHQRLAPASSSVGKDPLAGLDSVEALRAALLGAQEAANSAAQSAQLAAEAAQKAAASAQDAAERAASLLALSTSFLGNSLPTASGPLPSRGASWDTRVLPRRIILVRHGESQVRTRGFR
jgi:hypothetical protein